MIMPEDDRGPELEDYRVCKCRAEHNKIIFVAAFSLVAYFSINTLPLTITVRLFVFGKEVLRVQKYKFQHICIAKAHSGPIHC